MGCLTPVVSTTFACYSEEEGEDDRRTESGCIIKQIEKRKSQQKDYD